MMETTAYHKILRISLLVVTCVFVFQGGFVSTVTSRYALQTERYLANAVGVSVGVAPNEFNEITAGLTKRELALAQREAEVAEREIEIGLTPGETTRQQTTTLILAIVLFILLVLVVFNYILDYLRSRYPAVPINRTVRT